MAFMNAKKRNKVMTYIIVAMVSVGLLLSVSVYWYGSTDSYSVPPVGTTTTSTAPTTNEGQALQAFSQGMNLRQEGKITESIKFFKAAIPGFEAAVKTNPKNIEALGDLATAYHYSGNSDKGIELAKQALTVNPKFSRARMNMAIYLAEGKGKTQEAIAELEKIDAKDSNYQQAQQLITSLKQPAPAGAPGGGGALPPGGNAVQPGNTNQLPGNNAVQPNTGSQLPGTNAVQPGTGTPANN